MRNINFRKNFQPHFWLILLTKLIILIFIFKETWKNYNFRLAAHFDLRVLFFEFWTLHSNCLFNLTEFYPKTPINPCILDVRFQFDVMFQNFKKFLQKFPQGHPTPATKNRAITFHTIQFQSSNRCTSKWDFFFFFFSQSNEIFMLLQVDLSKLSQRRRRRWEKNEMIYRIIKL